MRNEFNRKIHPNEVFSCVWLKFKVTMLVTHGRKNCKQWKCHNRTWTAKQTESAEIKTCVYFHLVRWLEHITLTNTSQTNFQNTTKWFRMIEFCTNFVHESDYIQLSAWHFICCCCCCCCFYFVACCAHCQLPISITILLACIETPNKTKCKCVIIIN